MIKQYELLAAYLRARFADDERAYTAGLAQAVRLIGEILGEPARAERLVAAASDGWKMVGRRVADVPSGGQTRLYMANPDLQTYGSGKFTGVMMAHAGGLNVARTVRGWARVSMEDVLRWNPQVIFVQDRYASVAQEIRASAQGLIALITYGVGIGLGSVLSGKVVDAFTVNGVKEWATIWWIPCVFAAVIALFFALTFKERTEEKAKDWSQESEDRSRKSEAAVLTSDF